MNTTTVETLIESTTQDANEVMAQAMRELGELELALVGGGTGAVIWA